MTSHEAGPPLAFQELHMAPRDTAESPAQQEEIVGPSSSASRQSPDASQDEQDNSFQSTHTQQSMYSFYGTQGADDCDGGDDDDANNAGDDAADGEGGAHSYDENGKKRRRRTNRDEANVLASVYVVGRAVDKRLPAEICVVPL